MPIRTALLTVSDRRGLVPLAKMLAQNGVRLYATGGTARLLSGHRVKVRRVEALTKFPEILNGRVKTLHPAVFSGLLARSSDDRTLARFRFPRFDLLVCNFYDFPDAPKSGNKDLSDKIDIGGVALVRAAAKNFEQVATLVSPSQYGEFANRFLQNDSDAPDYRRRLAAIAWGAVAQYDLKILGAGLARLDGQQPKLYFEAAEEALSLRYGENPHQIASFFLPITSAGLPFKVLQGKPLSYCNLLDIDAAVSLWADAPRRPFCAILKHTNPCGASVGRHAGEAFRRAFNGDPQSAFGGVVVFNRRVDARAAREMAERFFEVIVAPGYDPKSRKILGAKKNLRLLEIRPADMPHPGRRLQIRSVLGGILVQSADAGVLPQARWKRMAGSAKSRSAKQDLDLAMRLAKHVKSNAIVLVRGAQAIGIGSGQQSRVDSVKIALDKARRYGHSLQGAACASDGFFPFHDSVELLAKSGITSIVEPGGSVRDGDVVAAARKHNLALFFSGRRHFRH
ncbi:bifunctional phosphoribosylaminoimidazolecarboxamide formyltransferase/IMP cyclohydrolase [bacterium]|nr:bifunctional phosphoribosylaminoimidazolecarboxamide formyltransferase/IMP cyclohydrolase [bacterium]